jgi:hypothetical protein
MAIERRWFRFNVSSTNFVVDFVSSVDFYGSFKAIDRCNKIREVFCRVRAADSTNGQEFDCTDNRPGLMEMIRVSLDGTGIPQATTSNFMKVAAGANALGVSIFEFFPVPNRAVDLNVQFVLKETMSFQFILYQGCLLDSGFSLGDTANFTVEVYLCVETETK